MENVLKRISLALFASCFAITGCVANPAQQAPSPQAITCKGPPGSVCLSQAELNVLGPIVGGRFQQLQQEYQALGSVIQDIQRQTQPNPPATQPPTDSKK